MDRGFLPFRINCEGYFIDGKGNILARINEQGFIIFPGGGIDEGEGVENGMIRETKEETGAIITDIEEIYVKNFIWEKDWAKTDKQKKRYQQYKGDEMHFFKGKIEKFEDSGLDEEDKWPSDKLMALKEVIKLVERRKNSDINQKEYIEMQLKFLKNLH